MYKRQVGTYQKSRHYGFVIPDNQKFSSDLFIPEGKSMNAENGQKVVAQILSYGEEGKNPEGEIKEILGSITDPGTDILSIAKAYDIPMDFPPEVLEQLEEIPCLLYTSYGLLYKSVCYCWYSQVSDSSV